MNSANQHRTAGVDGANGGWVVCIWDTHTHHVQPVFKKTFADVLEVTADVGVVAVDMPIGLLDVPRAGGRSCDCQARKILGGHAAAAIFSPPVRPVIQESEYHNALKLTRDLSNGEIGLSAQAFGIASKVREIDDAMTHERQSVIHEAHPELTFWALNRCKPLAGKKRSAQGILHRMQLVEDVGLLTLDARKQIIETAQLPNNVTIDDLLDACALAWTAHRISQGDAVRIPETPEIDNRGIRMEMWY